MDATLNRMRTARDGEEVSLAGGVALRPGSGRVRGQMICCDCGLVHIHEYRITKRGTLMLRTTRDEEATKQWRAYRTKRK
jgi:hypothetical protein